MAAVSAAMRTLTSRRQQVTARVSRLHQLHPPILWVTDPFYQILIFQLLDEPRNGRGAYLLSIGEGAHREWTAEDDDGEGG